MNNKLKCETKIHLPVVAIVGRTNVGKSALFNTILKRRIAIVHDERGVTRDRISSSVNWCKKNFLLVDTGGLGHFKGERIKKEMDELTQEQLDVAIQNADKVILVVDITSGVSPLDQDLANLLRERGKKVIVAANKADNPERFDLAFEFTTLGFEEIIPISCLQGINIGDLLDSVSCDFPTCEEQCSEPEPTPTKIAVVGRPNMGKSSIVNRFLEEDRVIVNHQPGTTRDSVDIPCSIVCGDKNLPVILVDTAGLRLSRKVDSAVDYYSITRTRAAIKKADIILLVLDGTNPVTSFDKKICKMIIDENKTCILVANKWDLACKMYLQKDLIQQIKDSLPFFDFPPILTSCAVSGYNFNEIKQTIIELSEQLSIKIPTTVVNKVLKNIVSRYEPPRTLLGVFKIYYGVFKENNPPTFLLFVNNVERCSKNYFIHLKKQFRQAFGLAGLPIKILMQEHGEKKSFVEL